MVAIVAIVAIVAVEKQEVLSIMSVCLYSSFLRRVILSSVASLGLSYFYTFYHKWQIFGKK
jgi:hypothetical protein